jgi:hypothetical protein
MTLAIAHRENERAVLDALREVRPPFSPDTVVREFASLLKLYRIDTVLGDRYAGKWPREAFRRCSVEYAQANKTKNEIYGALVPMINSRSVRLLDNGQLLAQLTSLERRTGRSGQDLIDHRPGGHDDIANAAAGALVELTNPPSIKNDGFYKWMLAQLQEDRNATSRARPPAWLPFIT